MRTNIICVGKFRHQRFLHLPGLRYRCLAPKAQLASFGPAWTAPRTRWDAAFSGISTGDLPGAGPWIVLSF